MSVGKGKYSTYRLKVGKSNNTKTQIANFIISLYKSFIIFIALFWLLCLSYAIYDMFNTSNVTPLFTLYIFGTRHQISVNQILFVNIFIKRGKYTPPKRRKYEMKINIKAHMDDMRPKKMRIWNIHTKLSTSTTTTKIKREKLNFEGGRY